MIKQLKLALIIAYSGLTPVAMSQKKIDGFAINPKVGGYVSNPFDYGLVYGGEFHLKSKNKLFSIDYFEYHESGKLFSSAPTIISRQVGLMFGKTFGDDAAKIQIQSGISGFFGKERTDQYLGGGSPTFGGGTYATRDIFTLGIPAKLGIKFYPTHFFGFGLDLQGFVSPTRQHVMPMFSLEFGRLKVKK